MPKKILIIEDDPAIVKYLQAVFSDNGYLTCTASSSTEGLDVVRKEKPDLIILDITMPVMTGIEMLGKLKAESALKDIPVIMLTAESGKENVMQIVKMGVKDYIVKPFNFLELSARIKSIFKRLERSLVNDQVDFKHLSINFKSRDIKIRGESVKLTKTEFELLSLFVSYPGEVLSREFIQQQIWNLFISHGVILGLGVSIGGMLAMMTVTNNWFVMKRPMALTVSMSSMGLGAVILKPSLVKLIETIGWRDTYLITAAAVVLLCVILPALFLVNKP